MKISNKILVIIVMWHASGAMQQNDSNTLTASQVDAAQKQQAEKLFEEYRQLAPVKDKDVQKLQKKFPVLFENVPEELWPALVQYAQMIFKDEIKKKLKEIVSLGSISILHFRLKALASHYGAMPWYSSTQHYLYFDKDNNKKAILKGSCSAFSLPMFDQAEQQFLEKQTFLTIVKAENDLLEKQFKKKCTAVQSKDCDALAKEISDRKKRYQDNLISFRASQEMKNRNASKLTQQYKIHLMPIGDVTATVIKLLQALQKDPELQMLVDSFKVLLNTNYVIGATVYPRIVIYPAQGKQEAQKVLNKLYALFEGSKGLNQQPRFNAKVTDLLWIAQGDSLYKNNQRYQNYDKYFEQPNKVYYRSDITGQPENFYLLNPATQKEIH